MKRVVGLARYLVLAAVLGMVVLSVITFIWAGAKSVLLISDLLAPPLSLLADGVEQALTAFKWKPGGKAVPKQPADRS